MQGKENIESPINILREVREISVVIKQELDTMKENGIF